MRIRWQDNAVADLVEIRRFISLDNPDAATQIANSLRQSVANLADHPAMGRSGRITGTRELIVPNLPYIIPYRVETGSLVILRVLHTSRQWPESLPPQ